MNKGIKTVIYPVKDITQSKALFRKLLGVEPYADQPYYVGFKIGDQDIGLIPNGHNADMTAYFHVDDIKGSLQILLDADATIIQDIKDVGGGRLIASVKDRDVTSSDLFKINETQNSAANNTMERKTKVNAEDGKQELLITREFDLPVELLFKAYEDPEIVEQWMGTKVLKLDNKKQGGYQFETTDPQGNKHRFAGVIHEFNPNQRIIRTFEMENTPFGVQLEFLEFEKLTDDTSRLNMHVVFRSVELRDQLLKLPFALGINMAHNRIQDIVSKLK